MSRSYNFPLSLSNEGMALRVHERTGHLLDDFRVRVTIFRPSGLIDLSCMWAESVTYPLSVIAVAFW